MNNSHRQGIAVAYVRISDEEQLKKSATSIATQTRKCAEACERAGVELVKVFTDESESAFKQASTKRPQLQAMLKYLRQNKGKCTHVVFENLSRLARRDAEQDVLLDGFKALGLKYMSVDEPNVETDTAAGRLHAGLLARFNRYYSDSLSERVTYRMRAGASSGRHLHLAPLGYVNGKHNGVKNLVPDPERAELVRKAFTMMAEGQNMVEVLRIVTLWGLRSRGGHKLAKTTFSQMLHNRTYCGWVKQTDITARGAFEPLISEELFDRVQEAMQGRSKRQKNAKHHEDWPLRRFVLCGSCDKPLTAGWVRNSKGNRYGYYFCVRGCNGYTVKKDLMEAQWVALLGTLQPREELLNSVPKMVAAAWKHRAARAEEERRQLTARLNEQKALNQKTIEARVKGQISDEDFATMKKSITAELEEFEHQLKALDEEKHGMQELTQAYEYKVKNLAMFWQNANLKDRVELQFSLWSEGLRWTPKSAFLNTLNRSLFQQVEEMVRDLELGGGR
jgi:site-specific DNA recombinase